MQLEFEQKQFLNRCVLRARRYERAQFAAEVEKLRAEMEEQTAVLRRDLAAIHRKLAETIEEARLLRQWWQAHTEHRRAKAELAVLLRQQALEEAWATEFDPVNSVKH